MALTKSTLRESMRNERRALSRAEARERSEQILENLMTLPDFFRHDVVHTYVSSKENEADTHELIRVLLKQKKRVIVPIADPATKTMLHSELRSLSELKPGAYGILEPTMQRLVPASLPGVIVVPAVAVDRSGNRLGYGAGFYDRFLQERNCPTVTIVYDFQVVERVPTEKTDIPVSYIVTEQEIIRCRNKSTPES